jgi:dsDNA-specific endonuclease/ATPase MutS2
MKNTVRLSESQLINLIRKSIKEQENDRYMFFSNLEQIHRQTGLMLEMNENELHQILENGHDWAQDHIATAKESIDQVFDFFMNETNNHDDDMLMDEPEIMEGRKKTGTKLCARGKAAAKAKFKVWPSAYGNGFAVQVCQGRMKGLDGKKKCSSPYC